MKGKGDVWDSDDLLRWAVQSCVIPFIRSCSRALTGPPGLKRVKSFINVLSSYLEWIRKRIILKTMAWFLKFS